MLYKLLNFNNKKLGAYNLVFRYVKIRWHIFSMLLYLSLFFIPVEISIIFKRDHILLNFLVFTPLISMFILLFNLNSKAKSIVKQKYNIDSEGFGWRTISFDEYQVGLLIKYLKNDNLYSVDIVEKLISLVYKEAEENKYRGFIWPGILLALFIPIWNQIVTNGYKSIEGIRQLTETTTMFIVYLLLLVLSISMLKRIIEDFSKEILNEKYAKLNKLGKLLERVLLHVMKDEKLKV